MVKIDDNTRVDLDTLAVNHYNSLIGVIQGNGRYHPINSLVGRINAQKNLDAAIPDLTRVDFWDYLLNNNFTNLERLIISRPSGLKVIIEEIQDICGVGFFSNDIDYDNANLNAFGNIVKKVFNYSNYRDKPECRVNCNQFNLSYCPYCNEQLIQVITQINGATGDAKTRALLQLDHFYPQSRHPYFGVSFFNLIPGCSVCNAQLKGEKRFDITTHFNPFEKRLDDYFKFQLDSMFISTKDDVIISYDNKLPYPNNALEDFEIISRYKGDAHKRAAYNLVKTFKNHSRKINNSLTQQIIGLFIRNESRTRILLETYNVPLTREEINEVHLGKLKRDIAIQIGVLNNP